MQFGIHKLRQVNVLKTKNFHKPIQCASSAICSLQKNYESLIIPNCMGKIIGLLGCNIDAILLFVHLYELIFDFEHSLSTFCIVWV